MLGRRNDGPRLSHTRSFNRRSSFCYLWDDAMSLLSDHRRLYLLPGRGATGTKRRTTQKCQPYDSEGVFGDFFVLDEQRFPFCPSQLNIFIVIGTFTNCTASFIGTASWQMVVPEKEKLFLAIELTCHVSLGTVQVVAEQQMQKSMHIIYFAHMEARSLSSLTLAHFLLKQKRRMTTSSYKLWR